MTAREIVGLWRSYGGVAKVVGDTPKCIAPNGGLAIGSLAWVPPLNVACDHSGLTPDNVEELAELWGLIK